MEHGRLSLTSFSQTNEFVSAPPSADFLYQNSEDDIRDFILDKASETGRGLNFDNVIRLQEHLKALVEGESDFHERASALGEYAMQYRSSLEIPHQSLSPGERSVKVTSGLFLSNVAALSGLRSFIVNRYWAPNRAYNDRSKKEYLEKRKIYQDDIDTYYDFFNGNFPVEDLDTNLIDIANTARLLVSRKDWVGAITTTNNHEFVGSVLSERVVKQSLRPKFPETRYGTAEEDASPTKADVVVPLGHAALHLQVKMRISESDFRVRPESTPMGVVVPMPRLRSKLNKLERNQLISAVSKKVEEIEACVA